MSGTDRARGANEAGGVDTVGELAVGGQVPDFELRDHAANQRLLSQLVGGDPTVLHFYRGWWCPKEQAFFRRLVALQEDAEVAYSRIVSLSVDLPQVNAAFRAGSEHAGRSSPIPTARSRPSSDSARPLTHSTTRTFPPWS
jgi:hypothetical protein